MSAKKECHNCEFFIDKKCAISQSKYYEIDYEKNEKKNVIFKHGLRSTSKRKRTKAR